MISAGKLIPFIFLLLACSHLQASQYYVSASATGNGNGSIDDPWQLQEALSSPLPITYPLDTVWVWIRGGVYTNSFDIQNSFVCKTNGSREAPIIFRNYQDERVTIDGQLPYTMSFVLGNCSHTWIWGLEFTNSNTADRDHTTIDRRGNLYCTAEHIRFINLIIHDMGSGLDMWKTAKDAVAYGCLIYHIGNNLNNNGNWEGHGHGMYLQNDTVGIKTIHNNIIFNNFGNGIKIWQTSATSAIGNFDVRNNIVFNGGAASENMGGVGNNSRTHNFFVVANAADHPITNTVIKHNYTFSGTNTPRPPVNAFGLNYGVKNMLLDSNYLTGQTRLGTNNTPIFDASVRGNTIMAGIPAEYGYYLWGFTDTDYPANMYVPTPPDSGLTYFVSPNKYEPSRSHLVIYNWGNADTVHIDMTSAGLQAGDSYALIHAMDYYNDIDSGMVSLEGTIAVPMNGHTFAPVIGSSKPVVSQFPTFGAFVIRKMETEVISSIIESPQPGELSIYPNPSNGDITLKFSVLRSGHYQIELINIHGTVISNQAGQYFSAGEHEIKLDTHGMENGVYIVHINGATSSLTRRLLLVR